AILEEGWDEQDVRQALIRSPERRQQRIGASTGQAEDMVRRAYRSVLGREPDPSGMSHYTAKVLLEHWTEEDLVQALRDSDEYREKHRERRVRRRGPRAARGRRRARRGPGDGGGPSCAAR